MAEVGPSKVVTFHYTLTNPGGQTLDASRGQAPLPYLHGASNIVPGLERQMAGKKVGDRFQAIVPPDEGYGERVEGATRPMSRDDLPDNIALEPGMPFGMHAPDGEPFVVWVSRIEGDTIWMDANHPLSGVTLHYDVEIVDIRDATDDEIAQGHPHTEEGQPEQGE